MKKMSDLMIQYLICGFNAFNDWNHFNHPLGNPCNEKDVGLDDPSMIHYIDRFIDFNDLIHLYDLRESNHPLKAIRAMKKMSDLMIRRQLH